MCNETEAKSLPELCSRLPAEVMPTLTVFFGAVVIFIVLLIAPAPVVRGLGDDLCFLLKQKSFSQA